MNQVLELPGLPNSGTCIFEPLQVCLHLLAHVLRTYFHVALYKVIVWDFGLLGCQEVNYCLVHLSLLREQDLVVLILQLVKDLVLLRKVLVKEIGLLDCALVWLVVFDVVVKGRQPFQR